MGVPSECIPQAETAACLRTLFRVAGESIAPLEGYFQDSTKNFQARSRFPRCKRSYSQVLRQVYSKIWDKPQDEPEAETLEPYL